ncbi:hypothetical protein QYE76_007635 [Lolium multiflorum]|uniref:Retrotransposon gag domain-containing protein n=1 Tax=Lolium multiflorum TaxID=4521 RepID=A0AAD8QJP6_LOLMU|nr:hypothetical protein QYE76_007635 [Lolium multiflorum]
MSMEVLTQIVGLKSAEEVWKAILEMFSSQSKARVVHLRTQLNQMRKENKTAAVYFNQIKTLADEMAAAGKPLDNDDVISYRSGGTPAPPVVCRSICGTTSRTRARCRLEASRLFVLLNHCSPVGFGSNTFWHARWDIGTIFRSNHVVIYISLRENQATSAAPTVDEITTIMRDKFGILPKKRMIGYSKPYPNDYDLIPLPPKYRLPDFTKFSGSEGTSSIEHVSRYLAQLGMVSASDELRVRFFSASHGSSLWVVHLVATKLGSDVEAAGRAIP